MKFATNKECGLIRDQLTCTASPYGFLVLVTSVVLPSTPLSSGWQGPFLRAWSWQQRLNIYRVLPPRPNTSLYHSYLVLHNTTLNCIHPTGRGSRLEGLFLESPRIETGTVFQHLPNLQVLSLCRYPEVTVGDVIAVCGLDKPSAPPPLYIRLTDCQRIGPRENRRLTAMLKGAHLVVNWDSVSGRGKLKCEGTRAGTRFRLSAKRTSPFKSAAESVQWTTCSRGVRISGTNAWYTMFRSSVKCTGYPLHSPVSPSLPLPCVTVCHHISTGV